MRIAHPKDKGFFRAWPIALAGFALAAAGLACSALSLGGGSSKDYTALFDAPASPSSVRPELDPSGASHAVIAAAGGTIEATGSDGTRFVLSVPEGALPLEGEISLTPVRSVADLPLSELGGAVVIGPVDLQFHEIATLTIEPALDIPLAEQITFGFEAEGRDFHLSPPGADPETVQILVLNSGGFGVGRAAAGDRQALLDRLPTSPANRFAHQLADVLLRARQQGLSAGIESEARSLVAAYYDSFIRRLEAAGEPPQSNAAGYGGLALAVPPAAAVSCREARELYDLGLYQKYLQELGVTEGVGFREPPDDLVLQLAEACLAEAHEECVADDNLARLPLVYLDLYLQGELGLASDAALAQITTIARGLMEKCYRFDLEMISTVGGKIEPFQFESTMTSNVHLRLGAVTDLATAIVFSELELAGAAPLYNESLTINGDMGDCNLTAARGGGEFEVIKIPLILGGNGLSEVTLSYNPGQSSESLTIKCPGVPAQVLPFPYWSSGYVALHADEGSSTGLFVAPDWEILGGKEVARKEYVRPQGGLFSEDTTFTLIHTPAP
jgi:hypothetical protein